MTTSAANDVLRGVSLCWLTLAEAGHVELIEAAADAGFGAVGMKLAPRPGDGVRPIAGDAALTAEVRAALRDTGLDVLEMGGIWLSADANVAAHVQTFALAAEFGVPFVIAVGADPEPARLASNLFDLCELASQHGIRTAVEFAPYTTIETLEAARALIGRIGHPLASILVDALHFHRSGGTLSELAAQPNTDVSIFHLCDALLRAPPDLPREGRSARLYPGEGELPLLEMISSLPRTVRLEVEAPCQRHAGASFKERARRAANATRRLLESQSSVKSSTCRTAAGHDF